MENDQEQWEEHVKAVGIARTLVREETALWREDAGIPDDAYSASAMAMEMQLFALSLREPMAAGGLDTVEFFCELTGVDFSNIVETMNNVISYGRNVVEAEDSNGE